MICLISNRIHQIQLSATLAATQKTRELKEAGIDVISLTVGEPDFDTPAYILDAANQAMYEGKGHHYTASAGISELREAISTYHKSYDDIDYRPDQIFVSAGAKLVLYYLFQSLINEGDEVLVPTPYWVSYSEQIKLAGGVPVFIETSIDDDFAVTEELLERYTTKKTKLLILNSPSNPSGVVFNKEQLTTIGNFCVKHNIFIISDEIYNRLVFNGATSPSMASLSEAIKKQTIVVNGMSKAFAMTGWRMGYAMADTTIIQALDKIASQTSGNPAGISQYAALAALTNATDFLKYNQALFEDRLNHAYPLVASLEGFKLQAKPQGAFYLFPDCQEASKLTGYDNVDDFVMALLEEAHVGLVAGSGFGMPNHVRFSYATSEETFHEGVRRIAEFIEKKKISHKESHQEV